MPSAKHPREKQKKKAKKQQQLKADQSPSISVGMP